MLSMTGYGKSEYSCEGLKFVVEIKAVNNRNFDFNCKSPRAFMAFEDMIRKTVQEYVSRGRIDLFINFTDMREKESAIEVDLEKAVAYYNASKLISDKLGLQNDMSVSSIMRSPDVLVDNSVVDYSDLEGVLKETVKSACEKFNEMRKIEGERLVQDMLSRIDAIESLVKNISERAPLVVSEYRERLQNKIEDFLADVELDQARLLNEVAFFTDKVNIDEEITRLKSHIKQFRSIVSSNGSGKKLDFLMQEFNRESNTICSKSNDIEVTSNALSLKNEIEKVREQVQNLE